MNRAPVDIVARAYFAIKACVLSAGYEWEIEESARRLRERPDEKGFLREAAWVIISSGMRASVLQSKFPALSGAFMEWRSADAITARRQECMDRALRIINHPGKIAAIADVAEWVSAHGFAKVLADWDEKPLESLMRFAYVGPVTSYHLAKNLGLDVAKPDRHLTRIAASVGWRDSVRLCSEVGLRIGEPAAVVDTVFWRYATLSPDYLPAWLALISDATSAERKISRPASGTTARQNLHERPSCLRQESS